MALFITFIEVKGPYPSLLPKGDGEETHLNRFPTISINRHIIHQGGAVLRI